MTSLGSLVFATLILQQSPANPTTPAGQIVNVSCTVVHRAGLSDVDQREQIRLAAHECGAILTGISIPVR